MTQQFFPNDSLKKAYDKEMCFEKKQKKHSDIIGACVSVALLVVFAIGALHVWNATQDVAGFATVLLVVACIGYFFVNCIVKLLQETNCDGGRTNEVVTLCDDCLEYKYTEGKRNYVVTIKYDVIDEVFFFDAEDFFDADEIPKDETISDISLFFNRLDGVCIKSSDVHKKEHYRLHKRESQVTEYDIPKYFNVNQELAKSICSLCNIE